MRKQLATAINTAMKTIMATTVTAGLVGLVAASSPNEARAEFRAEPRVEQSDPLKIMVSLEDQHMKVYRGTQLVASSNISSGKRGHATPTGIFSVMEKRRHHKSNIYSNAPMPFMQRLTWSGIALHASDHVPRHPASHGCIRMPHGFANKLFRMRTHGVHVIIEDNPQPPRYIRHENLFQPAAFDPSQDIPPIEAVERTGEQHDNAPARIFITRRTAKDDLVDTQRLLNKLGFDAGEVDGFIGPQTRAAIRKFREQNALPEGTAIDNLLLDQLYKAALELRPPNGRLLVRKRQETIFEAGFILREPHRPLGSHLFTTTGFDRKNEATEWIVTSLADRVQGRINVSNGKKIDITTQRGSARDTLSRLVIFPHIREKIARHLTPGSSITVSDNGMSEETGEKGTDFIVITKPGENIAQSAGVHTKNTKPVAQSRPSGMTVIAGN